jgi:hypothetical protein
MTPAATGMPGAIVTSWRVSTRGHAGVAVSEPFGPLPSDVSTRTWMSCVLLTSLSLRCPLRRSFVPSLQTTLLDQFKIGEHPTRLLISLHGGILAGVLVGGTTEPRTQVLTNVTGLVSTTSTTTRPLSMQVYVSAADAEPATRPSAAPKSPAKRARPVLR